MTTKDDKPADREAHVMLVGFEVDELFRWPKHMAQRLAQRGKLPHLILPDGSIRFERQAVLAVVKRQPVTDPKGASFE